MIRFATAFFMIIIFFAVPMAGAQEKMQKQENDSFSLITGTPEEGFQLAIMLSRKAVTETQPDKEVLKKLRPAYAHDPNSLIAASQVVAINFQTIAAANNYWRNDQ